MHLRELIHQPVNLIISILFVVSFGLVSTSIILQNVGLDDPVTGFGEWVGLKILDRAFGPTSTGGYGA